MIEIHNEDCFEYMSRVKENTFDYIVTSPPYNRKRNDKYQHFDDQNDNYFEFLNNVISELLRITKKTVFFNIAHNYYNRPDVLKIIGKYANDIKEIIIWEKTNPLPAQGTNITNAYEFFICFGERPQAKRTYTKNIFKTSIAKMPEEHKAVMHQDACNHIFDCFITKSSLIYDPFLGTGTTALSAHEHNCFFVGTEISERYYQISKERIELHTRQYKLFGSIHD